MPLYIIIIDVIDPDLILLVNMLSVAGRLATLKWYYSKIFYFSWPVETGLNYKVFQV